ncbi:DUF6069 family protein [Lapillicoccus sp.]|uniref:DUF6069 family protein n=1 Tax=Lapillicoccus sp. TaxID=1909287 RepID=UPI003264F978
MSSTTIRPATDVRTSLRPWRALLASVAAPVMVWLAVTRFSGTALLVASGKSTQEVGIVAVVLAALVGASGALLVAVLAQRRAVHPRRVFLAVTLPLLVVSLAGPLSQATTTGSALGLAALHLVVAATALPLLAHRLVSRSAREARG